MRLSLILAIWMSASCTCMGQVARQVEPSGNRTADVNNNGLATTGMPSEASPSEASPRETSLGQSSWPQGSGAAGNFATTSSVEQTAGRTTPVKWSVVRGDSIRWRKPLPQTGQSTVVVWGDRIFFTTMQETDADQTLGRNIVAWCCDAQTGETKWTRNIAGDYPLRLSGCFSDSTGPPAVTDGRHVCFFNASGRIACFDFDGSLVWQNEMMPVGRTQPFLVGTNVVFVKQSYMPDDQGHFSHEHKDAPLERWTQLQALDLATGKPAWSTACGVNMGSVSLPMQLSDGRPVVLVGRGGGHSPPENPEGVSMVSANDGTTRWSLSLPKFMSTQTFHVAQQHALVFDAGEHLWVDAATGKIDRRVSIVDQVNVRTHQSDGSWTDEVVSVDLGNKTRGIIQQSNVVAGRYHYFRAYNQPWLGRVDLVDGEVSYLQLPVQLRRTAGNPIDDLLWNWRGMTPEMIQLQKQSQRKPPRVLPIQLWAFAPNSCKNASGHIVMGDDRSRGNGWGHHASQVPTVIGKHLYVPTMSGTVYVIDAQAETFDENAIVAINDLGPVGESFTRASLSFANGHLYAHTIKEIICIQ